MWLPRGIAVMCHLCWGLLACPPWWHGDSRGFYHLHCFCFKESQRKQKLPWEKWTERSFVPRLGEWALECSLQMQPPLRMSIPFSQKNSSEYPTCREEALPALLMHFWFQRTSSRFSLLLPPGHQDKFLQTAVSSCASSVFWDIVTDIHCYFYFLPICSLLESLKIHRAPFARNELEAFSVCICTGQTKASPQQHPVFG